MALYLFDVDGTLVRSFMREGPGGARPEYHLVEVLPGRIDRLRELIDEGHHLALVSNQGGVAMGYQTPQEVCQKLTAVWDALGLTDVGWADRVIACAPDAQRAPDGLPIDVDPSAVPFAYVAFTHPEARLDRWRQRDMWRKPGGGMIEAAMLDRGAPTAGTVYVGDMETDVQAAVAAGVAYCDATVFFGTGDDGP